MKSIESCFASSKTEMYNNLGISDSVPDSWPYAYAYPGAGIDSLTGNIKSNSEVFDQSKIVKFITHNSWSYSQLKATANSDFTKVIDHNSFSSEASFGGGCPGICTAKVNFKLAFSKDHMGSSQNLSWTESACSVGKEISLETGNVPDLRSCLSETAKQLLDKIKNDSPDAKLRDIQQFRLLFGDYCIDKCKLGNFAVAQADLECKSSDNKLGFEFGYGAEVDSIFSSFSVNTSFKEMHEKYGFDGKIDVAVKGWPAENSNYDILVRDTNDVDQQMISQLLKGGKSVVYNDNDNDIIDPDFIVVGINTVPWSDIFPELKVESKPADYTNYVKCAKYYEGVLEMKSVLSFYFLFNPEFTINMPSSGVTQIMNDYDKVIAAVKVNVDNILSKKNKVTEEDYQNLQSSYADAVAGQSLLNSEWLDDIQHCFIGAPYGDLINVYGTDYYLTANADPIVDPISQMRYYAVQVTKLPAGYDPQIYYATRFFILPSYTNYKKTFPILKYADMLLYKCRSVTLF
jgi:hypothetical protein